MKRNYILGIIWTAVALALTLMLLRGLSGGFPGHWDAPLFLFGSGDETEAGSATRTNRFPAEDISYVKAELISVAVVADVSDDGMFHMDFTDKAEERCTVSLSGGSLSVKEKKRTRKELNRLGLKGAVCISIPAAYSGRLNIDSVSGSIRMNGLQAQSADVESVSGSISISGCTIGRLSVESVSGSIHADGSYEAVSAQSVSGSIKMECTEALKDKCTLESVSGSISLGLPRGMGYTLEYESMSGSFRDEITGTSGKKHGSSQNGGGVPISISTMSGSIKVREAGK